MQKYDSFSPKRATNIDGFFSKPPQAKPESRKPLFRATQESAKLADMPRRSQPQAVLETAAQATPENTIGDSLTGPLQKNQPSAAVALPPSDQPRQRKKAGGKPLKEKKPKAKLSRKQLMKRIGLGAGALLIVLAAWLGFRFYRDIAKITGNNNPFSLLSVFHPAPLKNQNGRVNILLAANSADDPGHDGANLTDSIMVLSVDTNNNTALMLSIPRDLWVELPDGGYHSKINAAYPDGGMDELQEIVANVTGMTIDYNALISYDAFRDMVNAVGGITINIQSDDPRGIYDPSLDWTNSHCCALAKYPNGPVTLNGKQALNLARARGDAYGSYGYAQSDFTRTNFQRQMLLAVKDKASQASIIANPFKVANFVDAVGNNVKTDLKLNEIETLYTYMKKIDDTQIDSYNINTLRGPNSTMLANYTSPDGQSALTPAAGVDDYSDIQTQLQKILSGNRVAVEGAIVVVLNATDTVGLAMQQVNSLIAKGMQVTADDAPTNQATTTLIDNSQGQMPATLAFLKSKYNNPQIVTNKSLTATYPSADFIVLLGANAVPKTTTK